MVLKKVSHYESVSAAWGRGDTITTILIMHLRILELHDTHTSWNGFMSNYVGTAVNGLSLNVLSNAVCENRRGSIRVKASGNRCVDSPIDQMQSDDTVLHKMLASWNIHWNIPSKIRCVFLPLKPLLSHTHIWRLSFKISIFLCSTAEHLYFNSYFKAVSLENAFPS